MREREPFNPKHHPPFQRAKEQKKLLIWTLDRIGPKVGDAFAGTTPEVAGKGRRYGLLQDSWISPYLWYPVKEGLLQAISPSADLFSGYDFRRETELPSKHTNPVKRGNLYVVERGIDPSTTAETLTPTGAVDIFKFSDFSELDNQSPESLTDKGYLRKTTYEKVLPKQGLEVYIPQVGDETVYEVTPQGNGRVYLLYLENAPKDPPKKKRRLRIPVLSLPVPNRPRLGFA